MYRLFIVEDEEIIRKGIREHISWSELGYKVVGEAENGYDALKIIPFVKPDVVLTDIKMPRMNGLELMRELKCCYPNIKVGVISGYSEFEYARKGIEYGAFAYILRPADDDTFIDIFTRLHKDLDMKREDTVKKNKINLEDNVDSILYKESVVSGILENRFDKIELENNITFLHKNGYKTHNYYGAMVFQAASIEKVINGEKFSPINIELPAYISQKILASLKSFNELNCKEILYDKKNSVFTLILSGSTILSKSDSLYAAKRIRTVILDYLDMEMGIKLFISTGIGRFYSLSKLAISYEEAKAALINKFYQGCGTVSHVDDCIFYNKNIVIPCNKDEGNSREYETSKKIIDALFQNNKISTRGILNHYFTVDKINYLSPEELYRKVVELISLISARLYDKGINIKEIMEDNIYDNIKKIVSTQSVTQLIDCIENMLNILNNNLFIKLESLEDKNEQFKSLLYYIEKNLDKRITLEELADKCFYSPQYFSKWFKSKTGLTFKEYHTHVRIKKAKELLERTNLKVYDISIMVGYDDYRYFSRIFKKLVGYSPGKYKSEITG